MTVNEPEAFQLLTLASARDNRTVSQSVAKVWAADLEQIPLPIAIEALTLHYREQPDKWLQPGHVVAGARRVRERHERERRIAGQRAIEPNQITLDRAEFDRLTNEAAEAARKRKEGESE
jgi:hypothetical protein